MQKLAGLLKENINEASGKINAKITAVEFDFESDDDYGDVSPAEQKKFVASVIGKTYQVDDEDEIADAISDDTGWLVMSLQYELQDAIVQRKMKK